MPNSPSSKVKKPKTLIFIDDKIKTENGKINDINMRILLVLLSKSFCNSNCKRRNILIGFLISYYLLVVRIVLLDFPYVVQDVKV